jgi:RHS repeat-associated protein
LYPRDTIHQHYFKRFEGLKHYELTNHLGNVLAVINDRKIGKDTTTTIGTYDYWLAAIVSANDYYSFGATIPGRSYSSSSYNFGFNGKLKDDEVKGSGKSYDFGARIFDPRLGRWLSVDPLQMKYPGWSTYHFGFCSPIIVIDPNGRENVIVVGGVDINQHDRYKFTNSGIGQAFRTAISEPGEQTTLVLLTANMNEQEILEVQRSINAGNASGAQHVDLVIVGSAGELANYLNSKTTTSPDLSKTRTEDKITDVAVYGHGVSGEMAFGYDYNHTRSEEEEKTGFGSDEISKLNPDAFNDAEICLYNCNTATDKDGVNIAKDLSKQTNSRVEGYQGTTSYKNIYNAWNRLMFKLGINVQPADKQVKGSEGSTKKIYENGQEIE